MCPRSLLSYEVVNCLWREENPPTSQSLTDTRQGWLSLFHICDVGKSHLIMRDWGRISFSVQGPVAIQNKMHCLWSMGQKPADHRNHWSKSESTATGEGREFTCTWVLPWHTGRSRSRSTEKESLLRFRSQDLQIEKKRILSHYHETYTHENTNLSNLLKAQGTAFCIVR